MAVRAVLRSPSRFFRVMMASEAALGLLNLAAVNLRWDLWMAAYRRHWTYEPWADLPLSAMNLLLVALVGAMLFGTYRRERRRLAAGARS